MQTERILVIEDNENHAREIVERLQWRGYKVMPCYSSTAGLDAVRTFRPHLIILDLIMESTDAGFLVLRQVRDNPIVREIPVIVYSIRANETEAYVKSLSLGAVWCLDKNEGLAKLEATVQRAMDFSPNAGAAKQDAPMNLVFYEARSGALWIDGNQLTIELSALESKLLDYLSRNYGLVCSRDDIAEFVHESAASNDAIDRLVGRLRSKLRTYLDKDLIHSVHGVGYRLASHSNK